jgi:hypothetical protein
MTLWAPRRLPDERVLSGPARGAYAAAAFSTVNHLSYGACVWVRALDDPYGCFSATGRRAAGFQGAASEKVAKFA